LTRPAGPPVKAKFRVHPRYLLSQWAAHRKDLKINKEKARVYPKL